MNPKGKTPADWADERAEALLKEMRGKPAQVVLRMLASALRDVATESQKKAEEEFEKFEPVQEEFEGRYLLSTVDGFCDDCGVPYAEGEKVWWRGPGRGAYCEGCRKTIEWQKDQPKT